MFDTYPQAITQDTPQDERERKSFAKFQEVEKRLVSI